MEIPRKQFNQKEQKRLLDLFWGKWGKIDSAADFAVFIESFLDKKERGSIFRRLAIINLLNQGKSYRKIQRILGVSSVTISNVRDIIDGRHYSQKSPANRRPLSQTKENVSRRQKPLDLSELGKDYLSRFLKS